MHYHSRLVGKLSSTSMSFPVPRVFLPEKTPPMPLRAVLGLISLAVVLASGARAAEDTNPATCTATGNGETAACTATHDTTESPVNPTQRHNLDWIVEESVPPQLVDRECLICGGRYIDPLGELDALVEPDAADIEATASRSEIVGETVYLSGGVTVNQGYRRLRADQATLRRDQQSAELEGGIQVREPGVLIVGDSARLHSDSGEVDIDDSRFVLHAQQLRGAAASLQRDGDGLVHIHEGMLTFCAPEDNHWAIRADEMQLDLDTGVGIARGARFDVAGVPVLYVPWVRFPLDDRRKTGLLIPDIGSDSRGGVDVQVPVYLNLASNYDALYAPRFIQERGLNHEMELRYLDPRVGYWSASGAYLADDDRYSREVPEDRNHDRWAVGLQHQAVFSKRWRSRVDYGKVSDVDYLKDLDSSSLNTKRQANLLQLGSLDYLGDRWLVNMELQQFQALNDDIVRNNYKKLPQLTAQYRNSLAPFTLEPVAQAQYSYFDTDDNRVIGHRAYAEAGLTYPMIWTQGFIKPQVKYRHLQYSLSGSNLPSRDEQPSAGTAVVNIDSGLYFERSTRVAGNGLLQTLEPRLYYLYADYEDQSSHPDFDTAELTFNYNQLFRDTRFSGNDRLDDANQLAIGVTTRFISDEDGREQLSASLGTIVYFKDRRVRLEPTDPPLDSTTSELAGELRFNPNTRTTLRASVVWDPDSGNVNSANFTTGYIRGDNEIYNIGYTFRRPITLIGNQPVTEQLHFSAFVPINNQWNAFASWNYSLEAQTSVEDMIGIEYESCCWKLRLLHLRYFDTVAGGTNDFDNPDLERERSTQVQIILKGLGGFGDRVEGLLEDMIRGYEEREY